MDRQIKVQIADMGLTRQQGTLITYALGSCVGISLYDPVIKLGCLLHIMLPQAISPNESNPYKFADLGIREMLRKMSIMGGVQQRYICKIAGGAKMFDTGASNSALSNIGARNVQTVRAILRQSGIRISGEDVEGNRARTMIVDVATGVVRIRTIGFPEKQL